MVNTVFENNMWFRCSIHKDSVFVFIQNENGDKYGFKSGVLTPELEEITLVNAYFITQLPGRKSDVRDIVRITEYSLNNGLIIRRSLRRTTEIEVT